ncbi:MAG: hypothetical protein IT298_12610 [Chloroflexi bacterium]|jgi:hypothetical protein|nr:hypothetical protein [Chloroflexota bacterium]MBV6436075.1 hypothetical protein [Anaerolineae bacterium]MDL1914875.1 hypothetical protein [Anaerolineae bacterium CFX4]OQY86654.1 MAG: hypothetical protein B6D42_00735 [Anaerolineae bacterium UTCFX5]MCC6566595.1 hypothetical protein [Chloroflexota bacterium]
MSEDQSFQLYLVDGINKYHNARSRAFWHDIFHLLRGKSAELLSFDEIRAKLHLREESYRGLHDIPLDHIKGSVGRYRDFNRSFLPRRSVDQDRWSRVYAMASGQRGLPPIEVYQVGDVYFVRDGNHRVSVARELGAKTIQAHVTELSTPVPFHADMTDRDIDDIAAYSAFRDETGLATTRIHHQSLRLSDASRYPDLLGLIEIHRGFLGRVRGTPVSLETAAADWYDNVYRPVVTVMRKYHIMDEYPDRTEADLFLWMVRNLADLREQFEDAPTAPTRDNVIDFLRERGLNVPDNFLAENDPEVETLRFAANVIADAAGSEPGSDS